jgi:hypothetical protein
VRLARLLRRQAAECPRRPFELRGSQCNREVEQPLVGGRRRDTGQGADLGERELAAPVQSLFAGLSHTGGRKQPVR